MMGKVCQHCPGKTNALHWERNLRLLVMFNTDL
jgi:hypothetical protein